ncbi:MAG: HDOD domain-containing protein [Propionivibrio sp.]
MTDPQNSLLYLGRQPILGREQQLLAFALALQDGLIATEGGDAGADTAFAGVFAAPTSGQPLGPYRAFLPVDRDFLMGELIESLPAALVVLKLDTGIVPAADVVERCHSLRGQGFALAIHDAPGVDPALLPFVELAEIIAIDLATADATALPARVGQLRSGGRKLLAQNVETARQLELCQTLGFDLFQGYFFARPALNLSQKLKPAQRSLMRLLALAMEDADTSEIENAFKLEPGLTLDLLRLTNSAANGLTTRITSLRHAIAVLGRRQLQRWLQLLIYANADSGKSPKAAHAVSPLMQLAATRGRLMELLADSVQPGNREFADQSFMVGILSLMPTLLGLAMPEILAQLPFAQRVGLALTERTGLLGQLLVLVEATEQADRDALGEALRHLPAINARLLDSRLAQAMTWANNVGREQDSSE